MNWRKNGWRMSLILLTLGMVWGCDSEQPAPRPEAMPAPSAKTTKAPAAKATQKQARLPGGTVIGGEQLQVPFITWGGEMPLFYGNGGLETRNGTLFAKYGLNLKLTPGDDFEKQVADYKAGRTPFLRGTFRMIGTVNAQLCQDPKTCPQIFMQMTWSAGDHLVARKELKTLADLCQGDKKKVAIQRGGPHQGMLHDVLEDAGCSWDDLDIVWMDNLNGAGSPPEKFRSDPTIDAAFAITPDMIGLTGGLEQLGTGAEGTVTGAHVLVSTAERRRTIADVYAVRSDFAKSHAETVRNFAAAYLWSVEKVLDLKNAFEGSGSDEFLGLLAATVKIYGESVLPNEDEAFGLLLDASFVGHAGNVAFFSDPKNPHGFDYFSKQSNDLALKIKSAKKRRKLLSSPIDWKHSVFNGLKSAGIQAGNRFNAEAARAEIEALTAKGALGDNTVLSFTAYFDADQQAFDQRRYKKEFDQIIKLARSYTRAQIVIRGHADSTRLVAQTLRAGLKNGQIKQSGNPGAYSYTMKGRPLDLKSGRQILELVNDPSFNSLGEGNNPQEIAQAARDLSLSRAEAVRNALLAYARKKKAALDPTQLQIDGVGAREPFITKPRSAEEAAKNRRVEFAIVRVSAESASQSDYEL